MFKCSHWFVLHTVCLFFLYFCYKQFSFVFFLCLVQGLFSFSSHHFWLVIQSHYFYFVGLKYFCSINFPDSVRNLSDPRQKLLKKQQQKNNNLQSLLKTLKIVRKSQPQQHNFIWGLGSLQSGDSRV